MSGRLQLYKSKRNLSPAEPHLRFYSPRKASLLETSFGPEWRCAGRKNLRTAGCPELVFSTSRKEPKGRPQHQRKGGFASGNTPGAQGGAAGPAWGQPGWDPTEAGPSPEGCAGWVGPDQLGPGDNRALTLAWRQPRVFQRLPLDHTSQGLAPAASLPTLASPPARRAVSGPRRTERREL